VGLQHHRSGVRRGAAPPTRTLLGLGAGILALVLVALLDAHLHWWRSTPSAAAAAPVATPVTLKDNVCGKKLRPPTQYKHVVWIFEENYNFAYDPNHPETGVIGNPAAPFVSQLAARCASSTAFSDTHPGLHSEPHYLAALSGSQPARLL
jgi:hypothetical protein